MHHIHQIRTAALFFLLTGIVIRVLMPRRTETSDDNSWYTFAKRFIRRGGAILGSFCLYSGVFLLLIAFLE